MPILRRRKSSLIDGAAPDATELTVYLAAYLETLVRDHGRPPPVRRPVVDLRAS